MHVHWVFSFILTFHRVWYVNGNKCETCFAIHRWENMVVNLCQTHFQTTVHCNKVWWRLIAMLLWQAHVKGDVEKKRKILKVERWNILRMTLKMSLTVIITFTHPTLCVIHSWPCYVLEYVSDSLTFSLPSVTAVHASTVFFSPSDHSWMHWLNGY